MKKNNINPKQTIESAKRPLNRDHVKVPDQVAKLQSGERSPEEKNAQSTYYPIKPKV